MTASCNTVSHKSTNPNEDCTYPTIQAIHQLSSLCIPAKAGCEDLLRFGACFGAPPTRMRLLVPAGVGYRRIVELPHQDLVRGCSGNMSAIRGHRNVSDLVGHRHRVLRLVFRVSYVPYADGTVFSTGRKQSFIFLRLTVQGLP